MFVGAVYFAFWSLSKNAFEKAGGGSLGIHNVSSEAGRGCCNISIPYPCCCYDATAKVSFVFLAIVTRSRHCCMYEAKCS